MGALYNIAEATVGSFDLTTSLQLAKDVIVWILDVIKAEPLLAGAFVIGLLVPAGFAVVRKIKGTSRG